MNLQDPRFEASEEGDCLFIVYRDEINLKKQVLLVDAIARLADAKGLRKVIVDTRGNPVNFTLLDRHEAAIYAAGKFGARLAVAYIIDKEQLTGIVEDTAQNRGGNLRIFTEEGPARMWIEGR